MPNENARWPRCGVVDVVRSGLPGEGDLNMSYHKPTIKIESKLLLHQYWRGPAIGFRLWTRFFKYAIVIRIPEWAARFIVLINERRHLNESE